MKKINPIIIGVLLTGCMSNKVDPGIPSNVKLSAPEAYDARYIQTVEFNLDDKHLIGNPGKCLARVIDNKEHFLEDSASSFVGAYTGNYYIIEKGRDVGGGQSLIYSDPLSAIAKGTTVGTYQFGLVDITKIIAFKVHLELEPDKHSLKFTDITAAQQDTGIVNNDGFNRVGAWSGAKPVFVYELLSNVAENIKACLAS